jgi:uncharacterized phiE125 gp8 family phage protein
VALKRTVEPTEEPVSLDEAKSQCRVDTSDDDTFITGLIVAARQYVEGASRRAFITQTWRLSLDEWPGDDEIELPKPPLVSVTSVIYKDTVGAQTTLSSSLYIVDTDSEPGRVKLAYGESWPSDTLYPANPIQITYVAGYGAAAAVPAWVKQAIKLIVGHWYENREETIAGTIIKGIPLGADSLIWLNRGY